VHSHFIPGIDDGAPTIEASLELLRAMHGLGYGKVVTTPHSMADGYRNPPEVILGGLEKLRRAVKEQEIPIEVEAAAEYYLDHELQEKATAQKLLTFGSDMGTMEKLKDRGVLFQLNIIALMGAYGPAAKKQAEKIADRGWYEFLGSDCHSMKHIEAMQVALTEPYLHKLIDGGKLLNATL
jgi:tyrosine-protein phosphatase YwqE